jgi:hypothetical protein
MHIFIFTHVYENLPTCNDNRPSSSFQGRNDFKRYSALSKINEKNMRIFIFTHVYENLPTRNDS